MAAVDVRITGHVQGVFFRARTQEAAERLGVSGWVGNEPDGSVAARFEGPDEAVAELVDWCRQGPPRARVEQVAVSDAETSGSRGFVVR